MVTLNVVLELFSLYFTLVACGNKITESNEFDFFPVKDCNDASEQLGIFVLFNHSTYGVRCVTQSNVTSAIKLLWGEDRLTFFTRHKPQCETAGIS